MSQGYDIDLQIDDQGRGRLLIDGKEVRACGIEFVSKASQPVFVKVVLRAKSLKIKSTVATFVTASNGRHEPGQPLDVDEQGEARVMLYGEKG